MRKLVYLLGLLSLPVAGTAQVTRTEILNPVTPGDLKTNSPAVPEVYAVPAQLERVLVARLKYHTDLLDGLQQIVTRENVRNGVILAGTGSVTGYHYHVVSNRTFPTKNTFVKNPNGPADIVSMNGYIIDGRVHAHITFSDAEKAFGGHLEPGTTVFTFAIVTIGVFKEPVDLSQIDDKHYR
jgi:predicted DNA-binding protein with PD1-like motif